MTDEYLDLYVLAAASFIFTILGVVGIASIADLASGILALLAVLALSQVRSRYHFAAIMRSQRADPLGILEASFPQDLIERRAAAKDVLIIGTSLSRTVQGSARTDMRRLLLNGGRIRALLLDPSDEDLVRAVSRNSSLWPSAERLRRRILATLDELNDLRESTDGHLEVRVASFPPMIGVNAIDLGNPDAMIVVQHYEYKPVGEAAPIICLKAADGLWFEHYAAEANRMWEDGSPWPLSTRDVLSHSSRPPFLTTFGAGLDQTVSGARCLLVTGVTRNTFVNAHYAKLEELLRNGCQIRFMLIDPDCSAINAAADRYYAGRSARTVADRSRQTIQLLGELRRATHGDISLKLTRHPLAIGVICVDTSPAQPAESTSLFAEYYPFQSQGETKFILQPSDGHWYKYFIAEAEALWTAAAEVALDDPPPASTTP